MRGAIAAPVPVCRQIDAGNSTAVPAVVRGVLAGAAGTAAMTAYQLAVRRARGQRLDTPVPRTWADAPAPARVAKRAAEAVGHPRAVTKKDVPRVTTAMHWGYGVAWGVIYASATRGSRPSPLLGGAVLGAAVWAAAYAELVPLGIFKPPWEYPASELGLDLSYHLVYGAAVAAAYAALQN
jgi:hypothetical protein